MANKNKKTEGNVPGIYYVDDECTGCGICENTSPENFKITDDGTAAVYKQPNELKEKENCKTALEECPVEAIGNDG